MASFLSVKVDSMKHWSGASEHYASRMRNGAGFARILLTTLAVGALATKLGPPCGPVGAFHVVCQHHARHRKPFGQRNLERVLQDRPDAGAGDDRKGFGLGYQRKVSRVSSVPSFGAPPTASSSLGTTVFCLQVSGRAFSCSKRSNPCRASCQRPPATLPFRALQSPDRSVPFPS